MLGFYSNIALTTYYIDKLYQYSATVLSKQHIFINYWFNSLYVSEDEEEKNLERIVKLTEWTLRSETIKEEGVRRV